MANTKQTVKKTVRKSRTKKSSISIEKAQLDSKIAVYEEKVVETTADNPVDKDDKDDGVVDAFTHWTSRQKGVYYPGFEVKKIEKIPPGSYSIGWDNGRGSYYVSKRESVMDDLLQLPIKEIKEIVNDVNHFLQRKDKFDQYGMIHKRGILMYGPPGCGKSCAIHQLSELLVEKYQGLIFFANTSDELTNFMGFVSEILRSIEPNTPIIFILEDIDNLLEYSRGSHSAILNILDGMQQCDNIIYLATTNYPEKLEERILNRPSRFDRRYKISYPNAEIRKMFLESKIKPEDKKKVDIVRWVKDTKGFTFAHLKELIISVVILENDYEESIKILRDMENLPTSGSTKKNVGFKNTLYLEEGEQ